MINYLGHFGVVLFMAGSYGSSFGATIKLFANSIHPEVGLFIDFPRR